MSASAGLKLATDTSELRFGPAGALRETFATSGRIHIDRWIPFVVLNRTDSAESSIARRVALNSPSYFLWSPEDDKEAQSALDLLVARLKQELGPILLIEVNDAITDLRGDDSPRLPSFEVQIASSPGKPARAAHEYLRASVEKNRVDLRRPDVSTSVLSEPGTDDVERLILTIPQIHRSPGGSIYPQLTHDLAAAFVDSLLCAASAFMGEASGGKPPHFRSLGRSAFLAAALKADKQLDALARSFDFLLSISPINTADARKRFLDEGCEREPKFRYRPLSVDPDSAKRDLYAIDFTIFEDLLLERLLREKRREIDMQLTMLAARNTPGFRPASMMLYGAVDSALLERAHHILETVEPRSSSKTRLGASEVADAARKLVDHYRSIDDRFEARVEVRDDVSGLLVSGGRLMISSDSSIATNRLDPLLAHEVSVHLLTYFNGATQGLTIFRTGLAHYEGIQEGLGVLAEWLVGGLTTHRLRLLAGRVIAVAAMIDGASFIEVYRALNRDLGFRSGVAFDIAARVFRSGGLAKDAIYLKGFLEVVNRIATGSSLDAFWLGKIAPEHVDAIEELLQRGLLHPPVFVPEFLGREDARKRIERLREGAPFEQLMAME